LNDSENFVREEAIKSLQIFGPEAKPAVPALIKLLHDNDDSIREQATNALLKIDPQAAAEAGLK
jgi:HEAT repeat protein